jgi:tetratricopeptide (TPR) repeat protein
MEPNRIMRSVLGVMVVGILTVALWSGARLAPAQFGTALSAALFERAEERGDLAAAEKHLDRLIQDQPKNPQWRSARSFLRAQRGNFKGAVEDAEQIIKDYPRLPLGYFCLLNAKSVTATDEEHLALVKAARKNMGEDEPVVNMTLASHYHYLGLHAEALELLDRAMAMVEGNPFAPDEFKARLAAYRVLILYDMGRTEDATAALDEALRRFPGNEEVEESRSELLIAEGRLQEALSSFKELFRKRPKKSLNTWFDRAQAYYMTGKYKEAREDLEEALRRAPADSHSRLGISAMLILEGKYAEAESYITRNLPEILRDRVSARQTSNSLVNRRQDRVTVDMLGVSTVNPYYNRALARALQGKTKLALADATLAAKGAEPFAPYEPAEALKAALEAGAKIRINPKPIVLKPEEDKPKESPTP